MAVDAAAAATRDGMTRTDYIKARIFGLPTPDRTQLRLVDSLHVAGIALQSMIKRPDLEPADHAEAQSLMRVMRDLVERIAKTL